MGIIRLEMCGRLYTPPPWPSSIFPLSIIPKHSGRIRIQTACAIDCDCHKPYHCNRRRTP